MNYVGDFLGRLPARPARMVDRPAMPQGAIGLQSAPPRPPGHPSSPGAVQPGPHPMGPAGVDPNLLIPPALARLLGHRAHDEPAPTPQPGPPYVPDPGPEGDVAVPGLPQGAIFPPVVDPNWPPPGGIHGPTEPGQQPNPGNGWGGLYPGGTIQNNRPVTPIMRFLLSRTPNAV